MYVAIFVRRICQHRATSKISKSDWQKEISKPSVSAKWCPKEEADMQRRSKPDPARQYGMHLDERLTLQTRRRFMSTEPRDIEQIRAKYTVMENL